MKTIPHLVVRMIPRLASNSDGEVVATARAIERTLRNVGADLHDLAAAIVTDRKPLPSDAFAPIWRALSLERRIAWLSALHRFAGLSPWERQFTQDAYDRVRRNPAIGLSGRQVVIVNGLLAKAWAEGVRP